MFKEIYLIIKSIFKIFSGVKSHAIFPIFLISLIFMPNHKIFAQTTPGPYEIIPLEDAYIIEAWYDLLAGTSRADWTGWMGTTWESPHAYNGHTGTDFALDTNTPVYAAASGQVTAVTTNIPENTGTSYGNYVRIAVTGKSPLGENLDVITAHLLPTVQVTVGQNVTVGQLVGYSDNTGNSTSEHCHFECLLRTGETLCPFYNALFKYPIMFNPKGTVQVGHIVKIISASTPVRTERWESATSFATVYKNQLYFATYWQRGYYNIFIPNNTTYRTGWVKAIDVEEVFTGTVIQALPDAVAYVHNQTLQNPYSIRAAADASANEVGKIYYGGGRFVADQIQSGWYRIPVPGSASYGWVKPDGRMVVYPTLYNPNVDLNILKRNDFPIRESFSTVGLSPFGRPKFNRSFVKEFSPAAPNGDGKAIFLTDSINFGDGLCESVLVGKVNHRNYFVKADVYFAYKPTQGGYERYGIFIRDDGFAGIDQTFEGKGNCYAMLFDSDDGRVRAAKIVDSTITDFLPTQKYEPSSGWHNFKIEAEENKIRYFMDEIMLIEATDSTFPSGPCGIIFSNRTSANPADRGAYFDNFIANTSETSYSGHVIIAY